MNPVIIGISLGLLVILTTLIVKSLDKPILYGLVLAGIGFLYVGFTWMDIPTLAVTIVQAIVFLMIAHSGIRNNLTFLTAGYFLHGLWDLAYGLFGESRLLPPHYDMFCLSIDFTIGFYLVILQYKLKSARS